MTAFMNSLQVFSGNANRPLAEEICRYLGIELGKANTTRFPDGEFNFQILENVRGSDVFIVQSTCPPVDNNLMELLIMLDAFRRSSADRITAVMPYYGYARGDKKDKPRIAITAKLVANLVTVAGADRVLSVDMHAQQIQGFFDIPFDHLFAAPVMVEYFQHHPPENLVVVSPDPGGAERAGLCQAVERRFRHCGQAARQDPARPRRSRSDERRRRSRRTQLSDRGRYGGHRRNADESG